MRGKPAKGEWRTKMTCHPGEDWGVVHKEVGLTLGLCSTKPFLNTACLDTDIYFWASPFSWFPQAFPTTFLSESGHSFGMLTSRSKCAGYRALLLKWFWVSLVWSIVCRHSFKLVEYSFISKYLGGVSWFYPYIFHTYVFTAPNFTSSTNWFKKHQW